MRKRNLERSLRCPSIGETGRHLGRVSFTIGHGERLLHIEALGMNTPTSDSTQRSGCRTRSLFHRGNCSEFVSVEKSLINTSLVKIELITYLFQGVALHHRAASTSFVILH
ncbi:hypothetical protein EVAR_65778_1 [Eumeta japonica]|uniref:Uncharacterized protein n=1 Tax=Eumeta variegata TaxID=151549 RepID=A0A4C2A0W4_EUMVA|nr:hypothetical protein EVAR_65778_1 [Eumeta japonica]